MKDTQEASKGQAAAKTQSFVRVEGGLEEILEGHGITVRGEPFTVKSPELAAQLVAGIRSKTQPDTRFKEA